MVRRGADPHRGALHRRDGAAPRRSRSTWATERVQFGERIYDFQGVSFPLADSAADASAARLLTRECAWLADTGADPKVVHAKASLAKLFASEAAWRCADRVVQVFGGRGYMREFAAGAVPARAARRPDLGGHLGDPAADHRPRAGEAGRRPGRRVSGTGARDGGARGRSTSGRCSRRGASPSSGRRRARGSPRRSATTCGSWAARRAATSSTRSTTSSTASPATRASTRCPERPDIAVVALNPLRAASVTEAAAAAGVPAVVIPGGGVVEGGAAAARDAGRGRADRPRARPGPARAELHGRHRPRRQQRDVHRRRVALAAARRASPGSPSPAR